MARTLGWWLLHVGVTWILVMASVAILSVLAVATVLGSFPDDVEHMLFGVGAGSWLVGIAWGVWINGLPERVST